MVKYDSTSRESYHLRTLYASRHVCPLKRVANSYDVSHAAS